MATASTPSAIPAPFPLVDVDDLHDADLEAELAERLSEALGPARELAELVRRPGPGRGALSAHALGAHVLPLALG